MRLWSIHPKYLDTRGLLTLWREALLAQKVLQGRTRGYRHHPQLLRFRRTTNPPGAIAAYLRAIATEAEKRGYHFDRNKIAARYYRGSIAVATGQLRYEFAHLLNKLATRDKSRHKYLLHSRRIYTHPLFSRVRGGIAEWEVL